MASLSSLFSDLGHDWREYEEWIFHECMPRQLFIFVRAGPQPGKLQNMDRAGEAIELKQNMDHDCTKWV